MKILGTGLTGLVGSRIVELLQARVEFEASDTDITDQKAITDKITSSDAPIVLHLAAKARVDGCEEDKKLGEQGDAWKINVVGTENIAKACSISGKKMVYISTDFVFDGENAPYDEDAKPNPINWYGQTKYEGERKVTSTQSLSWIIARLAYPYRAHFPRNDFVRFMIDRFKNHQEIEAITDHFFTPTFIDEIAEAFYVLCSENKEGIFHVAGSQSVSPYTAALFIAKEFGFDQSLVKKSTRAEFFKNVAKRPYRSELKNDKIAQLGVKMSSFSEGLIKLKQQL